MHFCLVNSKTVILTSWLMGTLESLVGATLNGPAKKGLAAVAGEASKVQRSGPVPADAADPVRLVVAFAEAGKASVLGPTAPTSAPEATCGCKTQFYYQKRDFDILLK